MSCSVYLWRDLIKNKGGVGLFQISQKERLFHLLWQPSVLAVNLIKWPPFFHPLKRAFLSPSVWRGRAERRAYWFFWSLSWCFLFPRVGIALPPHVRDSLEDKSMSFLSKKVFLLPSVWPGTKYTWALIWKKSLLICFGSYQGILYSHTGRVDRNVNTLLMVNINPICKR